MHDVSTKTSILIVDDDLGITDTLSDILEDIGYEVAVANDGYMAIEMIKKIAYNITLMDIRMPGINGIDTFRQVKNISPLTKVIMMTAYSVEDLIKHALAEGAYGVLYKPLDLEKVIELIDKARQGSFILLVDDDPTHCDNLKDILDDKGYKVGVSHNGKEAVSCVKDNHYDIVFIDVKMPVLNGLETYLEIKKIRPQIIAIMITGFRQETKELVAEAINKSAYMCMYKPLSIDKVIAVVEEISRQKLNIF
jgi:two-component system response regulator HydG